MSAQQDETESSAKKPKRAKAPTTQTKKGVIAGGLAAIAAFSAAGVIYFINRNDKGNSA